MHGTYRVQARISGGGATRFAPMDDVRSAGWATTALLLTGWTLLGSGWQAPVAAPAVPPMHFVAPSPPAPRAPGKPAEIRPLPPPATRSAALDRFVPVVRIDLPAPPPIAEPSPPALAAAVPPVPELPAQLPPGPSQTPVALRPVDLEQIGGNGEPSPQIAQLADSEVAPADGALAEKAQVAQLSVPRAVERELALLQEGAPAEVAVRFGDRTLGKVAIRVNQINTIDVQVSGLLDVMADRFAPAEFARLRGSAAADSYVSLDQLRATGLGLRYDPVYDELVVSV